MPKGEILQLKARVGQRVELALDENPTTGFLWVLDEEVPGLEIEKTFKAPETDALGAGGKRIFSFRASSPGRFEVVLHHRRPWEPLQKTTRHKTIVLIVSAD